jgi:hypothetical protein
MADVQKAYQAFQKMQTKNCEGKATKTQVNAAEKRYLKAVSDNAKKELEEKVKKSKDVAKRVTSSCSAKVSGAKRKPKPKPKAKPKPKTTTRKKR